MVQRWVLDPTTSALPAVQDCQQTTQLFAIRNYTHFINYELGEINRENNEKKWGRAGTRTVDVETKETKLTTGPHQLCCGLKIRICSFLSVYYGKLLFFLGMLENNKDF